MLLLDSGFETLDGKNNIMSVPQKVADQLMSLKISELNEVMQLVQEIKVMKPKSTISVGDRVYVVQKTKKTLATVRKINKTRQQLLIW